MNTASLELCKELFELSGWDSTDWRWYKTPKLIRKGSSPEHDYSYWVIKQAGYRGKTADWVNAYDLGYLLRELPADGTTSITIFKKTSIFKDGVHTNYEAIYKYEVLGDLTSTWERADTPEDAACKLAIELIKQGVIKP